MRELGARLMRAREARGLTLEDAERDTRINRRYLQALEAEQFEVIPAPVYARGFLRSYSQYLGLDAQEMLSLFPREDDHEQGAPETTAQAARSNSGRPVPREPISAVGPARPSWRKPGPPQRAAEGRPPSRREAPPPQRPQPPRRPSDPDREPEVGWEPTIGIDIGVPTPARRINTDPAHQTRTMGAVIVAIAAVAGIVLLAILISKLGGDSNGANFPGTGTLAPAGTATLAPAGSGAETPAAGASPAAGSSGLATTPGVVPELRGQTLAVARAALQEAGFVAKELRQANAAAKNTIIDQSPAPGIQQAAGTTVTIVVSDGQQ
ncbi:MAG: helix-turn-helix domain-containing protein [Chloroflexi bacterium]|nr:helix-turn-helix domain-containing protein [Chloroflexota bacterium]